jgi:L-2-hydroxyglutarate oxidase
VIHDYVVIGGGIVGLAVARALTIRRPGCSIVLLEKEHRLAAHQTGHNSGVIHAGVYYEPGSLKAELCVRGAAATKEYCAEHGIPFRTPGKLIVATSPSELPRMSALAQRAGANGLSIRELDRAGLQELEPNISGLGAILVPTTGIVDYTEVCRVMAGELVAKGVQIYTGTAAVAITETSDTVTVRTSAHETLQARRLVACAGVQADRVARLAGLTPDFRNVPFRGEYFRLPRAGTPITEHLIYPVPDPDLPFLGIHITPMIDGSVTVGPNAVLGLAREKYPKGSMSLRDTASWLSFPGFWRFARRNVRTGAMELRNSYLKRAYAAMVQRYAPSVTAADLSPYPPGIRAQIVNRDGTLVHDFLFESTDRTVHVCNAPSPAATAAMPIGEMIVDRVLAG